MPFADVAFDLLVDAKFLTATELVALATTCKAARQHSQPTLLRLKQVYATLSPVLRHTLKRLPAIGRCTGSKWSFHEELQPKLYDSEFWGPLAQGLSPAQRALIYAMLIVRFPCYTQRIENGESAWDCLVDKTTLLPARIPSEEGTVGAPFYANLLFVSIVRNCFTRKILRVQDSDWLLSGIMETSMADKLDIRLLCCLLRHVTRTNTLHYYGFPFLTFKDWMDALGAVSLLNT